MVAPSLVVTPRVGVVREITTASRAVDQTTCAVEAAVGKAFAPETLASAAERVTGS